MNETPIIRALREQRVLIKGNADLVRGLRLSLVSNIVIDPREDRGEVVTNITLAYRHLEDAAMRLGKAIQAADAAKLAETLTAMQEPMPASFTTRDGNVVAARPCNSTERGS